MRRSEAYLGEAQTLSHTGSFGWDVSNGEIYWSRETFRIFEYEPTAKVTIEQVLQRTHPEDRSAVQQLIGRVSRERTEFDFEHRLLMPDGSVKHLRVMGRPAKDQWGGFEFVGAVSDVTERKRAESALRSSEEGIRLTLDSTNGLVATFSASGDLEHANRQFQNYTGRTLEQLKSDRGILHPEDRDRVMSQWGNSLKTGEPLYVESRLRRNDGTFRWFHVSAES